MGERIVLDLCGGSGEWSRPWRETGYDVRVIDLPTDVRLLHFPGKVHGVLAAPPCTVFAGSGARWPRTDDDLRGGLSVVDACLRLVVMCEPEWWVLENPIGKLTRWLGKPRMYFNPCDYGDPYTKKSALWGKFREPVKTPVEPVHGSAMWAKYGGKSERTKRLRSITPAGFARAFYLANTCAPLCLRCDSQDHTSAECAA